MVYQLFYQVKFKKKNFIKKLENNGVETRPIISGNFLKQPSVKKYNLDIDINLKNSDYVNKYGFFIGLPTEKISQKKIDKLVNALEKSI